MKMDHTNYFPKESTLFAQSIERLKGKQVAVCSHLRPDGDCIGSTVATVRTMNQLGIDALGLNQDEVPANLKTFVADTPLFLAADFQPEAQVAVTVDCADKKRIGDRLVNLFPEVALNIDHHISNKAYALENLIVPESSATAEILAGIFIDLGYKIDAVTAQALYVGIATDTGQFCFPSTTPKTFEIVRRLCEYGANPAEAALKLHERESFAKIKLLQEFLKTLSMEFENRVCVGLLESGVYEKTGANTEDSEGLVDYARSIAGVEIGVLIEERDGAIKASLRAKDPYYRVDLIAKHFGGGGHACAAGLNIEQSSIKEFYPQLTDALREHFNTLKKT
jgi:bifunctional oligoribonuclease and PAP phosphatase NrnA